MCFVSESDWTANIVEEWTDTAEKPVRCDECGDMIPIGSPIHRVFQQEHEQCRRCEDGECECPKVVDPRYASLGPCCDDCKCPKPDLGETFNYERCDQCEKFLQAVKTAEIESGCTPYESQPSLCGMIDEIIDGGADEAKKYFKVAARDFPTLKPWLGSMWRLMFVR